MELAPASHYGLVIFNHGSMGGIAFDESSNGDGLSMTDLQAAFNDIPFIDVVLLDACLMQEIEVATEMTDEVGYLVASQTQRGASKLGSKVRLDEALTWLSKKPSASARQFAIEIFNRDKEGTVSVLDMYWLGSLNDSLDYFARVALKSATTNDWGYLKEARNSATWFTWNSYRDLREYLSAVIQDKRITKVIRDAAKAPYNLLGKSAKKLIAAQKGKGTGLSILLPSDGTSIHWNYTSQSYTFLDSTDKHGTHWRDFLLKLPAIATTSAQWDIDQTEDSLPDNPDEAMNIEAAEAPAWIHSYINNPEDVDFVRITPSAGDVLYTHVTGGAGRGGLQAVVTLYGPDQHTVLAQEIGGEDGKAILGGFLLPAHGDYYIAITSEGNRDPLNPVAGETGGEYTLVATFGPPEVVSPQLAVNKKVLEFARTTVESWSTATISLSNRGRTPLTISGFNLRDETLLLKAPYHPIALPIMLGANDSIELEVGVSPQIEGPISNQLYIASTDPENPEFNVQIEAEGSEPEVAPDEPIVNQARENWLWGNYDATIDAYATILRISDDPAERKLANKRYDWLSRYQGRIIFADDLEDDTISTGARWSVHPGAPDTGTGEFVRVQEEGNYLLEGRGHYHAFANIKDSVLPEEFEVHLRFRPKSPVDDGAHINIMMDENEGRTTIGLYIAEKELSLWEGKHGSETRMIESKQFGPQWYALRAVVEGAQVRLFLDDKLILNYTSPRANVFINEFNLETLSGAVQFDDVLIISRIPQNQR